MGNEAWSCALNAQVSSVTQHGITWTFNSPRPVGQFVNGDYWVVGPVTVISVSPIPSAGRNGSMINPGDNQAYDSRAGKYQPAQAIAFPHLLQPGSSLISTISLPVVNANQTYVKTAAVLTCVSLAPPMGMFRPPYAGTVKTLYHSSQLIPVRLLPTLAPVAATPTLDSVSAKFEKPWIDHVIGWSARSTHPADNMPAYGREISDEINKAALMLLLDEKIIGSKQTLLIRFVQLGIDLMGVTRAGGSWPPDGGHASGRKWPIVFAGHMLGDIEMRDIKKTVMFGEDGQTFYVQQTAPGVINSGFGGYVAADLGIAEWGIRHATHPNMDSKLWTSNYRQCCTANAWAGAALAARIMKLRNDWSNDAFFDYQDRYMKVTAPNGSNPGWRAWSAFSANMWDTYRPYYY